MGPLLGILRKELKLYFTTPVAYAALSLFALLAGLFFWWLLRQYALESQLYLQLQRRDALELLNFNDRVLTPLYLGYVQIVFVCIVPLLTMRLVAEERRARTFELLLASPVSPWQIVGGKYLAVAVTVLALVALCAVYPLSLTLLGVGSGAAGPVDWSTVALTLAGLALFGLQCAAIGLLASVVTESQVVAAVLAAMALLFLWALSGVAGSVGGEAGAVLGYLSMSSHLVSFARGVLSLADVTYFVSAIALALFLAHRGVEGLRWS